ncbi:hypothetical protein N5079_19560 [Planotetraspora sp. A-T 1434]|uniref:hypothetical protein n=1 Tax=Planotetraspora sp. A-T 1434 TaxID=2979219 RepID=UPI0021C1230F|nr:hypothetical protein [Planotetraspora sp. A-T 1434]MCT9932401.1 hypothetical protein [Planotetraspora sp. A-T 1434]
MSAPDHGPSAWDYLASADALITDIELDDPVQAVRDAERAAAYKRAEQELTRLLREGGL